MPLHDTPVQPVPRVVVRSSMGNRMRCGTARPGCANPGFQRAASSVPTSPPAHGEPLRDSKSTNAVPLNVTLATFGVDLANLQGVTRSGRRRQARSRRDRTMKSFRAVLVAYRAAAQFRLAAYANLLTTLPGHTPAPVSINAVFVAPDIAEVTHSESDDADFKDYQLRGTAGPDGDAEDAVVLATHTARTQAPFSTKHALGIPGNAVTLWVFIITNDGNERASDPKVVTRPL